MPAAQNFKNHTRFHPPFHFVILPLLILNLIFSIYITIHRWPAYQHTNLWWIAMSIVFFLMAGLSRDYALKAQDRIIRLEERLRLQALLPPPTAPTSTSSRSPSSSPSASPPTPSSPTSPTAPSPKTWIPRPSSRPSSTGAPTTAASESRTAIVARRTKLRTVSPSGAQR
ncbi:DUF6526 family protein [Tunturiibacter empetritectus]